MPVPKPEKGEQEQEFVSRCISELSHTDPNRDQKQVIAICYSQWRQKESVRHQDFQVIFDRFATFFGEQEGAKMYSDFLKQNGLDDTKPYSLDQVLGESLTESFQWTTPLITYWKHDKEAKYYKTRLLTANVSMNLNDYTSPEYMQFAASNLGWRPLNLDHDHRLRLPFPDCRLEVGRVSEEGNSIEAVIRISNDQAKLQDMIEGREVVHPSIEAHPVCGLSSVSGKTVPSCGYYLDEVALLRKQYKLPGDPLSQIYPLPINEALAGSLIESLQTKHQDYVDLELQEELGEIKLKGVEKEKMAKDEQESPGYTPSESVDKEVKTKVEEAQKISDLTARVTELTEKVTALEIEGKAKDDKIVKANEDNAKLARENLKISILEKQMETLKNDYVAEKDKVSQLQGKTEDYTKQISKLEEEINKVDKKHDALQEKLGKVEAENEGLHRELNIESTKRAAAEQKALNETKERSKIQLESVELRDEITAATRKISELTENLGKDAKEHYATEKENAALKAENDGLKETLTVTRRKARALTKFVEGKGYKIRNADFTGE